MKRVRITKRQRRGKKTAAGDLYRIVHPREYCFRLGNTMMKKSPKAMAWTTLATTTGLLTSKLGLPGLTGAQATLIPLSVGLGMLGSGAAIKYVPNVKAMRLLTFSQANEMNRMEDYKKLNAWDHLDVIWDRVYKCESFMRYTDEQRQAEHDEIMRQKQNIIDDIKTWPDDRMEFLGMAKDGDGWEEKDIEDLAWALMCVRPLSDQTEKSKIGFKVSAMNTLGLPLTVSRKFSRCQRGMGGCPAVMNDEDNTGLKLDLYKDWIDGAMFDPSDTKLLEQYLAKDSIRDIKAELGMGVGIAIRDLPEKMQRRFWFYLMNRRMAFETGKAIQQLDWKYNTDKFNALIVLCPGEENAPWLDEYPDARQELAKHRRKIMHKTFGNDYEGACGFIDLIFSPDLVLATKLRLAYDPEYLHGDYIVHNGCKSVKVDGANSIRDDLAEHGYKHEAEELSWLFGVYAEHLEDMDKFIDYAKSIAGGLLSDMEALRSVKTAYYINSDMLRCRFRKKLAGKSDRYDEAAIAYSIERAVTCKEVYTSRLITIREHQALALMQLNEYKGLIKDLAFNETVS